MINKNNYAELVSQINYNNLPEGLQKGYDFVKKVTSNYMSWAVCDSSEKIKQTIDLYFSKVASYIKPIAKEPSITVKTLKKEGDKVSEQTEQIPVLKNKAAKTSTKANVATPNLTERLAEEIKVIKRFVNMQGKEKTQDDILRFITSLQKAIIERKVRKTSIQAKQIEYIQDHLIKTYDSMKMKVVYDIPSKQLEDLAAIVGAEKVYPSMLFIKKYIKLVGKTGVKQKATLLSKQLLSAVSKGKISKQDKYADKLNNIYKTLNEFLENPTQKTLEVDEQELNGLNGIIENCNCNLTGYEKPALMNSMDFANMQFETIGLSGKWRNLIGDPSPNFSTMVYGKPKMGKSYLCIDFAGHLARHHGNVLYVAKEEGLDFTLQKKLTDKNVLHPNLFVASELPKDLSPYQYIFLDSVNKLGYTAEQLNDLKKRYPYKSFIFIFQTTKNGNFRGSNSFQHDVDVVVEVVEKGKAIGFGRFGQGGSVEVW
jgi:hypothetical protein